MEVTFNTGETSSDLKNEYNPEGSILRKAQLRMLDMLLYVDNVCKEQGIQYALSSGNVLGAVRHGGFIPWDDDVDIMLLPHDYKKLVKYLKKHPHPQYKIQNDETDSHYYMFWSVLRDTKSEYIQDSYEHNIRKYRGLQVDIFCFENCVNQKLYVNVFKLYSCYTKKLLLRSLFLQKIWFLLFKYIIIPIVRFVGKPFSSKDFYHHAYGQPKGKAWLGNVPSNIFLPFVPIKFEGYEFLGPYDPVGYLKFTYGEYMDLPCKEKRNHHKATYRIWD